MHGRRQALEIIVARALIHVAPSWVTSGVEFRGTSYTHTSQCPSCRLVFEHWHQTVKTSRGFCSPRDSRVLFIKKKSQHENSLFRNIVGCCARRREKKRCKNRADHEWAACIGRKSYGGWRDVRGIWDALRRRIMQLDKFISIYRLASAVEIIQLTVAVCSVQVWT